MTLVSIYANILGKIVPYSELLLEVQKRFTKGSVGVYQPITRHFPANIDIFFLQVSVASHYKRVNTYTY